MSKVKIEKKKSSGSSQDAPLRKEAAGTPDVSKKASGKIPNLFTEFAWFPLQLDVLYGFLASKARQELWGMPDNPFFILDSYFIHTYLLTMKCGALALTRDGNNCCFDTGLVTPHLSPIYAFFEKNRNQQKQKWFFHGWLDALEISRLNLFERLPQRPPLIDSPCSLFYDPRVELRLDEEKFTLPEEDRKRLQQACPTVQRTAQDDVLKQRFPRTTRLVSLFPRTVVPLYIPGCTTPRFAVPIFITSMAAQSPALAQKNYMEYPDIAMIVEKNSDAPHPDENDPTQFYYSYVSLLSLATTYKFARLLGRVESDWLVIPNSIIYNARLQQIQIQSASASSRKGPSKFQGQKRPPPQRQVDQ